MYHFISFHPVPSGVYQVCIVFCQSGTQAPRFLGKASWTTFFREGILKVNLDALFMIEFANNCRTIVVCKQVQGC